MTEEQIERAVERRTDALDKRLMSGAITQAEYDRSMALLTKWADGQSEMEEHPLDIAEMQDREDRSAGDPFIEDHPFNPRNGGAGEY